MNPLETVQVVFKTPHTLEDLEKHRKEFLFLNCFSPLKLSEEAAWEIIKGSMPYSSLVYANGILVGCFIIDFYRNSAEIHGIARPDMGDIIPKASRVKVAVYNMLLTDIFTKFGKYKVFIKAEDSNKGVKGFARMWGFKRLQNLDKGRTVWTLDKKDFLNNGKKEINA